jgi:hypothetical protein
MAQARPIRQTKFFVVPFLGMLKRHAVQPPLSNGAAAVTPSLCTVCHGSADEWRCPDCNGRWTHLSAGYSGKPCRSTTRS